MRRHALRSLENLVADGARLVVLHLGPLRVAPAGGIRDGSPLAVPRRAHRLLKVSLAVPVAVLVVGADARGEPGDAAGGGTLTRLLPLVVVGVVVAGGHGGGVLVAAAPRAPGASRRHSHLEHGVVLLLGVDVGRTVGLRLNLAGGDVDGGGARVTTAAAAAAAPAPAAPATAASPATSAATAAPPAATADGGGRLGERLILDDPVRSLSVHLGDVLLQTALAVPGHAALAALEPPVVGEANVHARGVAPPAAAAARRRRRRRRLRGLLGGPRVVRLSLDERLDVLAPAVRALGPANVVVVDLAGG